MFIYLVLLKGFVLCPNQTHKKGKRHQLRDCAGQGKEAWFPTKTRDHQPLVVLLHNTGGNKAKKSINVDSNAVICCG